MSSKIYLNYNKSSWITISKIPIYLQKYAFNNFDKLFNLHPKNKGNVLVYNKNKDNPKWNEIECFRWHKSYLNTPIFNPNSNKSYMFSGWNMNLNNENIPNMFLPFYNFIKNEDVRYNQMTINWYKTSHDYMPLHSDCEYSMIQNHIITILNINKNNHNNLCKTFTIIPKETTKDYIYKKYDIKLTHGIIISMCGNMQNEFSHGVNNSIYSSTPRISMSFRQY